MIISFHLLIFESKKFKSKVHILEKFIKYFIIPLKDSHQFLWNIHLAYHYKLFFSLRVNLFL